MLRCKISSQCGELFLVNNGLSEKIDKHVTNTKLGKYGLSFKTNDACEFP